MFTERRIINAIKQNLLDAMSRDHRVFVVGSVDCISNGTSAPCVHYQLGELERALAYIDAEQLQLLPSRPTPAHGCPSGVPLKQQTYYMQWEKTRRCYNEVVRYEREAGVCFDWVVRTRTDSEWKSIAPPIGAFPYDAVTTTNIWGMNRGNNNLTVPRPLEDHVMVVPRPAASAAMNAVAQWFDCRSTAELEHAMHPNNAKRAPGALEDPTQNCPRRVDSVGADFLRAECMLGLYMHDHLRGVTGERFRWISDGRLDAQPRRMPGEIHSGYMNGMISIPGSWVDAADGGYQFKPNQTIKEEKARHYLAGWREAETRGWTQAGGVANVMDDGGMGYVLA